MTYKISPMGRSTKNVSSDKSEKKRCEKSTGMGMPRQNRIDYIEDVTLQYIA